MQHSSPMHFQNSVHGAANLLHWHLVVHFSLQPQVTVYISGSVMIHLLGSNTKSTEFQPNFTGFKLDSGTNIRFEKIKTKECDLRMYPCDISEVGGKDYNALFSFV